MLITLSLYILRELGKAMGLALMVFTFILMAVSSVQVIRDGASIFTVLKIMPNIFPLISPMVLPLTIITGTLICYGRLSASNEYIAVQASGINPRWFAAPALAVAILASIITVYLNADVLAAAVKGIESSLLADKTNILRRSLSKPGSFNFEDLCISRFPRSWDKASRAGIDIIQFRKAKDDENFDDKPINPEYPYPDKCYLAKDHSISLLEDKANDVIYVQVEGSNVIQLDLRGRDVQVPSAEKGKFKWVIQGDRGRTSISIGRVSYWGINYLIIKVREASEAMALEWKKHQELADTDAAASGWHLNRYKEERESWLKRLAELHMKLSLSFACIGFAVVGIPLGLRSRRGSTTNGFAIGIVVAVVYFVIIKALQGNVRDDHLGWWSLWLPNVALLVLGAILWWRGTDDK